MKKYIKYLYHAHDYQGINCITLIEKIYSELLNINFFEAWKKVEVTNRWKFYYQDELLEEIKSWKKIELTNLQEYDILIFTDRKDRIDHFGMYIGENKFIHIYDDSYSHIHELNQDYRNRLFGIYRHKDVV